MSYTSRYQLQESDDQTTVYIVDMLTLKHVAGPFDDDDAAFYLKRFQYYDLLAEFFTVVRDNGVNERANEIRDIIERCDPERVMTEFRDGIHGHFNAALAQAWDVADSSNKQKVQRLLEPKFTQIKESMRERTMP